MKPQQSIRKGKKFENWLVQQIEAHGLGAARREIGSGSGKRKGDIFANIPFLIEAKSHKATSVLSWIDQAKEQARIGNHDPDKWVLVFRDPRSPEENPTAYAVIDVHEFLELLKKNSEPLIKEPDRQLKYDIQRLVDAGKKVIKQLD